MGTTERVPAGLCQPASVTELENAASSITSVNITVCITLRLLNRELKPQNGEASVARHTSGLPRGSP